MEKMYQDYKDIADFRLVYINEAHAADGRSPVGYAKELGITEHTSFGERCEVASKLLDDKSLTIPTIVDGMDNRVNKAYSAWPDRVFLVRKDGRLAVAAGRGPFGFKPALDETLAWLKEYREKGTEPALPESALPASEGLPTLQSLAGVWTVEFTIEQGDQSQTAAGEMRLTAEDGQPGGEISLENEDQPARITTASIKEWTLRMSVDTPEDEDWAFVGSTIAGEIVGTWTSADSPVTVRMVAKRKP